MDTVSFRHRICRLFERFSAKSVLRMAVPIRRRDPFGKISLRRYLFDKNIELDSAPLRSLALITEPFMLLKKIAGQLRHTVLCVYADIALTGNLIVTDIESLPDDFNALSPAILFNVLVLTQLYEHQRGLCS